MKRLKATLTNIASGKTFSMSAILKAEKLAHSLDDKALLRRYRNGNAKDTDHIALQDFANRLPSKSSK